MITQSVQFGNFSLDPNGRQLLKHGVPVPLTPKAFELLSVLIEHRPRALSKSELSAAVWPGVFVADEGLPRLINEIRGALDDTVREARWIRTVHGFGYAFASEAGMAATLSKRFMLTLSSTEIPLTDGEHVIGREPGVAVCVDASVVSRRHARIVVAGSRATVEDLGSKNGTYVSDARLTGPRTLQDGDVIRIGTVVLSFRSLGATATQTLRS